MAKSARGNSCASANAIFLGLEDGASSQSKNIISELRSVHDVAGVDRFGLNMIQISDRMCTITWVVSGRKRRSQRTLGGKAKQG